MDPLVETVEGAPFTVSVQRLHREHFILEGQRMSCSRCGGYLASEPSNDFYHPEERWRCINCGAHSSLCSYSSGERQAKSRRTISNITVDDLRITRHP